MARTVAQCNTLLVNSLVANFAAVGVTIDPTKWSTRNLMRLICYTIAIGQATLEQLWDVALASMTSVQQKAIAGSFAWLQDRIFRFQYSPTTPQLLVVTNGTADYATINENLRIIDACAISSTIANTVNIKVATGSPLGALTSPQLSSLTSYVYNIGIAGITYNLTSTASDKLYLEGTIYYNGSYSAIISDNVKNGIESYLANLSATRFGGDILMSDIEVFVKSIEGVNDVIFERVSCRTSTQSIFGGIDLVLYGDWINRKYVTNSGYMVAENTVGYTIDDKITFVAE
jgi:hypothetical protein